MLIYRNVIIDINKFNFVMSIKVAESFNFPVCQGVLLAEEQMRLQAERDSLTRLRVSTKAMGRVINVQLSAGNWFETLWILCNVSTLDVKPIELIAMTRIIKFSPIHSCTETHFPIVLSCENSRYRLQYTV